MKERMVLRRPGHATVVAYLSLFLAVGGGFAVAAGHLGKNVVGPKQLKRNAVTTAKIKKNAVTTAKVRNGAITAAKIRPGTLTGSQIKEAELAPVPQAEVAASVGPAEDWHEVGAPGEPDFLGGWENLEIEEPAPAQFSTTAFYKDQIGVVHLRGTLKSTGGQFVFRLPPGFRPAAGTSLNFPVICDCEGPGTISIFGGGTDPEFEGMVSGGGGEQLSLDGIAFRAES
jgi:hypothetical protein